MAIPLDSRGTIKLDFFHTKRLYWFASAYFEQDTFQDLKLRTTLASGPGHLLDRGDLSGILEGMTLWAEADRVSQYHFQEGIQSLSNSNDLYVTADTGLRFKVWGALGYSFDTSRKQ